MRSDERRVEQPFESVGNPGHGGVHDQDAGAVGSSCGGDLGDVAPIGQGRNARTAELQNDPGRGRAGHFSFPSSIGGKTPSAPDESARAGAAPPASAPTNGSRTRSARPALHAPGKKRGFDRRVSTAKSGSLVNAAGGRGQSSSSKSRRVFSSFLSASTSSSLLHAALPRLPWLRTRLSTRSNRRS